MALLSPARRTTLPQFLIGAYLVALVYGTLYPWSGWHWVGGAAFGFVTGAWPRWWTAFDVATNVVSYLPLGMLAVLAMPARRGARSAFALATLGACALSFVLEALQSHLPARVPSRLDWFANTAGAALGAGTAALTRLGGGHRWPGLRSAGAADARVDAFGMTLLALWTLLPLHPLRPLFGSADLTRVLSATDALQQTAAALRLGAEFGVFSEAMIVATAIIVIGMCVREMLPPGWPRAAITSWLVALAALARTAGDALLADGGPALAWLSAGAQGGLVLGAVALALLATAWRRTRLVIALGALALNVGLTSTFPVDAYHASLGSAAAAGSWRNFDGMLHGLGLAWPFAAAVWCLQRRRRARHHDRA